MTNGKTVVINRKVYCGGGGGAGNYSEYTVYCYDPSQGKWTALPPLPVRYFSLGQVNSKLVAVGGQKSNGTIISGVYTYHEEPLKWKQTIPPMPIATSSPGVLSLQSALVVAGGHIHKSSYTAAVEIFKPDTSQWYTTDYLPMACCQLSLVAIGNTCYALGGYNGSYLNQALYASVDDLLGNAVPANQTPHSGSSATQSAWKTWPDTPTYHPAVAVLAGNLLTVGGGKIPNGLSDMKQIYMYSPSTNSWIYICDLPAPRSIATVAVLSSTEILVIGGFCGTTVNTVYKGILHLKL